MADVPLPEPDGVVAAMWNVVRHGPNYDGRQNDVIAAAKAYAERHAAAVSAAKDAEIERLRAGANGLRTELLVLLADNAALRAEVAGLREFVEHVRRNGGTHLANMAIAVLAARKGDAC